MRGGVFLLSGSVSELSAFVGDLFAFAVFEVLSCVGLLVSCFICACWGSMYISSVKKYRTVFGRR